MSHMFPVTTDYDVVDVGWHHAVLGGQCGLADATGDPAGADFRDLHSGESGLPASFASLSRSPLARHIGVVIGVGAEKQVARAHAAADIARVQHALARRNISVGEQPGQSVRALGTTIVAVHAVTIASDSARPQPTAIRAISGDGVRPETLDRVTESVMCHGDVTPEHECLRLLGAQRTV